MSMAPAGVLYLGPCEWMQRPGVPCGLPAVAVDLTFGRCLCGAHAEATRAARRGRGEFAILEEAARIAGEAWRDGHEGTTR
jgi:hypothetical protein